MQRVPVITGRRSSFEARCRERGYSLDEVRACIVSEDGDTITVDETHEAYPRTNRSGTVRCLAGTALKELLAGPPFWIKDGGGCECKSRAALMDTWGCDECERREDEILGWLKDEANKRGLPFFDTAGRALIRIAINKARRATRDAKSHDSG